MSIFYLPRYSRIHQYISARLSRLEIDAGDISKLIQAFDLDLLGNPWNLPYGRRGNNVAVLTSEGKKVVRRYRNKWKISTINYEHSILKALIELNCPAPRLNTTPDSRNLIPLDGHNFALFDYADGMNYSSTYLLLSQRLSLIGCAAKALAHLHSCLDGFIPDGQHHLGFKGLTGERIRDQEWRQNKVVELREKSKNLLGSKDGVLLNWLIEHSEQQLELLGELERELSEADLPRVVIHGDYGLHNILFDKTGKIIPLDFELARIEWRLTDFVISFLRFRKRKGNLDNGLMERFIKAYVQENPIEPQEWALFPKVWQHNLLLFAIQYWNSYFETNMRSSRLSLARGAFQKAEWGRSQSKMLMDLIH